MRSEALDLYSICLGPFPWRVDKFDIKISSLQGCKIEKIIVLDETSLEKMMNWKKIGEHDYLVIELSKLE